MLYTEYIFVVSGAFIWRTSGFLEERKKAGVALHEQ